MVEIYCVNISVQRKNPQAVFRASTFYRLDYYTHIHVHVHVVYPTDCKHIVVWMYWQIELLIYERQNIKRL